MKATLLASRSANPRSTYLCDAASEYFATPIKRDDIVWTYSAVRPLYDDGASKAQEATRDYVLKAEGLEGQAPIVNIFGGKITTYRRLSEAMLDKIENLLGSKGKPWTATAPLPGGDFPANGFEAEVRKLKEQVRVPRLSRTRAGLCACMERRQVSFLVGQNRTPISEESSALISTRRRSATS